MKDLDVNKQKWYAQDNKVAYKNGSGMSFLVADCRQAPEAAPLIAAAPDLLEALKALEAEVQVNYRACFPKGRFHHEIEEMLEYARAAIEKAEEK